MSIDDPMRRNGPADRPNGEQHVPVLLERVEELLTPALVGPRPVLIDATLGFAGHTVSYLAAHPTLRVIGIDRDPQALAGASQRIAAAGFADRFQPIHAVYDELATVAAAARAWDGVRTGEPAANPTDDPAANMAGDPTDDPAANMADDPAANPTDDMADDPAANPTDDGFVDAVLFDLGVSSMQLDQHARGFSYAADVPLDMRMDPSGGLTAEHIVNTYSERELARVIRHYGDERFAARIARTIVARRAHEPLVRSAQLVEVIRSAIPAAAQRTGGHPAKRTFQALRIEVNDELGALRRAIPAALSVLRPGGRIVVMSYQSLEDRIVKRAIAPRTVSTTPLDLPVELEGHDPTFRWITRGSEKADAAELKANPRAASARLRAAMRVRADT